MITRQAIGLLDSTLYRALRDALAGFSVFLVAQLTVMAWTPDSARGSDTAGWFLNSGVNVAQIGAALAAAAALMALRRSADLLGAVWFAAGATTAMGESSWQSVPVPFFQS